MAALDGSLVYFDFGACLQVRFLPVLEMKFPPFSALLVLIAV